MGDAGDIGEGAIRRLVAHERVDDARHAHHAQRVAVGIRPRHHDVADEPAGPRMIFDEDSLPVERAQFIAERACEEVFRRAR
ncbi:hypothetical protein D3C83_90050 [compost metagenome]